MKVSIDGKEYKAVGKAIYSSKGEPESRQVKIFLEGGKSLLMFPEDKIAFFGFNFGRIGEFDGFPETAEYQGDVMELVNHDFQTEVSVEFGKTEGECEFWDYEYKDIESSNFVSVAVMPDGSRADVVLYEIDFDKIKFI